MLNGFPTKNGTGIKILGDYGDLKSLYNTIHKIADHRDDSEEAKKGIHQLLMNFAYEVRKAYSEHRIKEDLEYLGTENVVSYLGFQVVWTDILIFIAALRSKAGFRVTDKIDQANLYILEYIVEKALFEYDPKGANDIKEMIGQRITVSDKHVFIIYQKIHIEFLKKTKGKRRFREIPNLIGSHFSSWRDEYKEFMKYLEYLAEEKKCKTIELEFQDFPK